MERSSPAVPPALSIPPAAPESGGPQWGELLRHIRAAAYICNAEGYVTHFNEAAAMLWGRRPKIGQEQWCGSYRVFLKDGTLVPREQCPMAQCIRDRKAYFDVEAVCERPDGTRRLVRVSPSPIYNAAGSFQGALNEIIDITEFMQADQARSQLAAIVRTSDDSIISTDLDGVIRTWNNGAERLFGYTAEEALGRPVTMLLPSDRHDEEPEVLGRIRRGDSVDHYETVRRRKDGTLVDISLSVSPIFGSYKEIAGASKIARDISGRKQAEREVADADRRKDEFIAILAHELRNPLMPLTACLQLIRMAGYDGNHIARSTLEMMERQVKHLNRLVGDFLDLNRLTHGKIALHKERVAVGEVVSDALEIVSPMLESKGQRFELSASRGLFIDGDRTRLVQILANLLNNAAKFSPPKGQIHLAVDRHGNCARFCVKDTGVGIAAGDLEAIFAMFTRVRTPGVPEESGMGIGLALVRRLVDLHGGRVQVHSDGVGKGAEFTVLLPLATALAQVVKVAPPVTSVKAVPRRVLIVDDNADAAASIAMLLQGLGHEVKTAGSGAEALKLGRDFPADVVILDIGLPDMSGYDVATRLRNQPWGSQAVLVALTGWGSDRDRQRSAEVGIDHHFLKPIDLDALEILIASDRVTRH